MRTSWNLKEEETCATNKREFGKNFPYLPKLIYNHSQWTLSCSMITSSWNETPPSSEWTSRTHRRRKECKDHQTTRTRTLLSPSPSLVKTPACRCMPSELRTASSPLPHKLPCTLSWVHCYSSMLSFAKRKYCPPPGGRMRTFPNFFLPWSPASSQMLDVPITVTTDFAKSCALLGS